METRRRFLRHVALGLGVLACRTGAAQPAERAAYVGVETAAASGLSRAAFFAASGERVGSAALDFRAHGFAHHGRRLVVFPRRPGNRFAIVDRDSLEILAVITTPPDRHFYGHGAFTGDGAHLLVSENDLATLQGHLGIYEMGPPIVRLGTVPLPGAGPHELVRDHTSGRFHIALGGMETHPDYGRLPLNLSDFRSQILTFDPASGGIDAMGHWPGSEGVSLRHLAQDGQGRLYVGGQVVDERRAGTRSVLWLVEDGRPSNLTAGAGLAGYASSVAAHGAYATVTSKETGAILTFEGQAMVESRIERGASALALGNGLSAASGFKTLSVNGRRIAAPLGHEFDNHGLSLI